MVPAGRQLNHGVIVHQLQQVSVSGDNVYRHAVGFGLTGDSAQDIIRLVSFQFQNRDLKCLHHFTNTHDLPGQFIRHLLSGALVVLEKIIAKGRPGIETDR